MKINKKEFLKPESGVVQEKPVVQVKSSSNYGR